MNKQELIERIRDLKNLFGNKTKYIEKDAVIELVSKLHEPQEGQAEEAPRYVKNILARLRELPLHDREVWLKAIMGEFEQDFSHAKWREGYEQGKFEGAWVGNQLKDADKIRQELNKPVVPKFVADWYENHKNSLEFSVFDYVYRFDQNEESDFKNWFDELKTKSFQTLVNMHQFGYEVEKEKRYKVVMPNIASSGGVLTRIKHDDSWIWIDTLGTIVEGRTHTRKELEEANFGWVFDCEGVEVKEAE